MWLWGPQWRWAAGQRRLCGGAVRTADVCQDEAQNAAFQSSSESRVFHGETNRVMFIYHSCYLSCTAACTDDKPPDPRNELYWLKETRWTSWLKLSEMAHCLSLGGFLAITACSSFPQACYTCSTVSSNLPILIWIHETYVKMLVSHDPTNPSASCFSCGSNRFPLSVAGVKAVITLGGWSKCVILIQEALLVLPVAKLTLNQLPFFWEPQLIILQVKLSDTNGKCPPLLFRRRLKLKKWTDWWVYPGIRLPSTQTMSAWRGFFICGPWQIAVSLLHPPSYQPSILGSLNENYNPTKSSHRFFHDSSPNASKENQNPSTTVRAESICLNITCGTLGFLLQLTEAHLSPEHRITQVFEYAGSNNRSLLILQTHF